MMDRKKGQMENLTLVHKHDLTAAILVIHALREPGPLYENRPIDENIFSKLVWRTSCKASASVTYLEQADVR